MRTVSVSSARTPPSDFEPPSENCLPADIETTVYTAAVKRLTFFYRINHTINHFNRALIVVLMCLVRVDFLCVAETHHRTADGHFQRVAVKYCYQHKILPSSA